MIETALHYREKYNFSIIPVGRDKKPLIKWERYQTEKASSEQIKEWFKKWKNANIAIVTGSISNLGVIDADSKKGIEAVEELLPEACLTPICETPNGGRHYYMLCPAPTLPNNSRILIDSDYRGEGGFVVTVPSIGYNGKPYRWLPGLSIDEVELALLPEKYIDLVTGKAGYDVFNNNINNAFIYKGCKENVRNNPLKFVQGSRDENLFHVANCLIKGGMPANEALQVLEILALNCNPPFPQKELKHKIESALKRAETRERNLAQEVREWINLTNGYFFLTDVYEALHILTSEQKNNVYQIIYRLQKEGLLEKYGNKNGCYRRIDTTCTGIDFLNVTTEYLEIKWPFEFERYLRILPKNVIVIAGISNSGKTAFLLNVIEMNMNEHEIYYFSSEMGSIELRDRLSKFERSLDSWNFEAIERSSNFPDVIRPNAINIIDFLEIHDDFWKVGGMIKDIYDKLDKGIAIIAIQKDPQKEYGVGATRSLEKARLYLTMDSHSIKIMKAKNWVNPLINPNGLQLQFKLVKGCQFITVNDWSRREVFDKQA